jgi:hypothetical protein
MNLSLTKILFFCLKDSPDLPNCESIPEKSIFQIEYEEDINYKNKKEGD